MGIEIVLFWLLMACLSAVYIGYGYWVARVTHSEGSWLVILGWPALAFVTGIVGFLTMVKGVMYDRKGP